MASSTLLTKILADFELPQKVRHYLRVFLWEEKSKYRPKIG
jgi:hypothetical protein